MKKLAFLGSPECPKHDIRRYFSIFKFRFFEFLNDMIFGWTSVHWPEIFWNYWSQFSMILPFCQICQVFFLLGHLSIICQAMPKCYFVDIKHQIMIIKISTVFYLMLSWFFLQIMIDFCLWKYFKVRDKNMA